ncbi:Probable inactive receptor kinase At1g48480 [Linum grandiflorum]
MNPLSPPPPNPFIRPFFFLLTAALLFLTAESDLAADRAALVALRAAVGGRSVLWNLSDSPCNWVGVTCSEKRVVELRLPGMGLSGELPAGLGNLTKLLTLSLRFNAIRGNLPDDMVNLGSLKNLYLHGNLFAGEIPGFLYRMQSLVKINLADNQFTGSISPDFNNLTRLTTLFLERNQLTGPIPNLNVPPLEQFNVSLNNLSGPIPVALSRKPAAAFQGNSFLCGRPLADCSTGSDKKLSGGAVAGIVIGCVFGFLLILVILCFLRRRRRKPETEEVRVPNKGGVENLSPESGNNLVFFGNTPRNFNLEDLLRASAEVLGKGTFGTTYKATLDFGVVTAVKRLKDVIVCEREYREKIEEIGKMNHESLVPLKAYYFSNDEKLLVYDFMPMGSLSALLHGNRGGAGRTPMTWETRSTIALKSARGIAYLHSQGPSISHGNIKSSNILLNNSYNPRISDFGLNQVSVAPTLNPARPDSGYRAPEVTDVHKVSHKADVYSFGVLLLELLTGKAPVHEEGVSLPRWVRSVAKEEWSNEVFDIELLRYQNVEEEMVMMLQLAIDCSGQVPDSRPSMAEVCGRIEEIFRLDRGGGGIGIVDVTSIDSFAPAIQSW